MDTLRLCLAEVIFLQVRILLLHSLLQQCDKLFHLHRFIQVLIHGGNAGAHGFHRLILKLERIGLQSLAQLLYLAVKHHCSVLDHAPHYHRLGIAGKLHPVDQQIVAPLQISLYAQGV